jgi:hypothetical protein
MSLLREIQEVATAESTRLSVLLRKCKVLAARLDNRPLGSWVDNELNGYPPTEPLPRYRILTGIECRGYFAGIGGASLNEAPIPPLCLPEEWRDHVKLVQLRDGVAVYEDLVQSPGGGSFEIRWPADVTAIVGRTIYRQMNCLSAWQVISRGALVSLLDTVRNRVLNFALEIEAAAPDAGEAPIGEPMISDDRVNRVFNTVIMGGTNTIAPGGSVQVAVGVQAGDIASLLQYLHRLGVTTGDATELERALRNDPKPKTKDGFGPQVTAWLGKMVSKAASGTWKLGSTVAADVLSKALLKYYGL